MITVAIDLPIIALSQAEYDVMKAEVLWYQAMPVSLNEVVGDSFNDRMSENFANIIGNAVPDMDEHVSYSNMYVNDAGELIATMYVDDEEGEYKDVVITII